MTRPQRVELSGVTLEIPPVLSEAVRRTMWSERYERGEARCVGRRLTADDVVLEVGAGIGFLSALCARRIGSERVHAYEADPALIPVIRRTYELNGVRPALVNAMLGDGDGEETFYVEPDFYSSSTRPRSPRSRPVAVPRLDARREIARVAPSFLIVDIEGGERELLPQLDLAGVRKIVIELHPAILGEGGMRSLEELLAAAGFRLDRPLSSTRKRFYFRPA